MRGIPQPSVAALRRARVLGTELASNCDRRLLAAIAIKHSVYESFQWDYRFRFEQMPQFQSYEYELQAMAEREARKSRFHLDDSRYWDALDACMLAPLKAAMWESCERRLRVEEIFTQSRPQNRRYTAPPHAQVLQVCVEAMKAATRKGASETATWDRVATTLFDRMHADDDDAFWQIPSSGFGDVNAVPPATAMPAAMAPNSST